MAGKRDKPEEIVTKLRQVEVLQGQGMAVAGAVRKIGVTQQTYDRWRKLYGGMDRTQWKRLKELEEENQSLRLAVSDLTLDKQILAEAAKGNFLARFDESTTFAALVCMPSPPFDERGPIRIVARIKLPPSRAEQIIAPSNASSRKAK